MDLGQQGGHVTRAERLMFLVQYLRQQRVASVAQMSAACGVSERSIFRDIASLSRMNIPIYYDRGYRLLREPSLPTRRLSSDELALIRYALACSPLAQELFWATRLRQIDQKLGHLTTIDTHGDSRLFVVTGAACVQPLRPSPATRHLKRFHRAIREQHHVTIETESGKHPGTPLQVRLERNRVLLILAERNSGPCHEIPLESVRAIRVMRPSPGRRRHTQKE